MKKRSRLGSRRPMYAAELAWAGGVPVVSFLALTARGLALTPGRRGIKGSACKGEPCTHDTSPDPLDRRARRAGGAARTARRTRLDDRPADESRESRPGAPDRAATAPRPLIWDRDFGDPSVVLDGTRWFGAATGFRGRASRSDYDWGTGGAAGDLLNAGRRGRSSPASGGRRSSRAPTAGVAYYTMPSRGLPHEQDRCIGVATAADLSPPSPVWATGRSCAPTTPRRARLRPGRPAGSACRGAASSTRRRTSLPTAAASCSTARRARPRRSG